MIQQMLTGVGVALGAILLQATARFNGRVNFVPNAMDFRLTFFAMGSLALLGVVQCLKLDRNAGAEVSGHRA
jgi:hypothetical protein